MSDQAWQLHHGDCLDVLATIPDNSIDCVLTDPPYFRLVDEPWDKAWDSADGFTTWLRQVAEEWQRVLKPNGTLYVFASSQMAARVELQVVEPAGFIVLNRLVWWKPKGRHGQNSRKTATVFHSGDNERILMAQPLKRDGEEQDALRSYENALHRLRAQVFAPLREYLESERARAGIAPKDIDRALGVNSMAGHWFGKSQWTLPSKERYEQLQALFNADSVGEYLRRDYEDLRRPFNLGERDPLRPMGEVWDFDHLQSAHKGRDSHPCEKPQTLLRHMIQTSTREGDTVLDTFAGSGAVGVAATQLDRRFIGIELSDHWHQVATRRISQAERFRQDTIAFQPSEDCA